MKRLSVKDRLLINHCLDNQRKRNHVYMKEYEQGSFRHDKLKKDNEHIEELIQTFKNWKNA